ncbi:hypothetical protein [Dyella japonica]|nr:hypothetical protein [Dyella japonica]
MSIDRFHIGYKDVYGYYEIERELGWNPSINKGCEYLFPLKMMKNGVAGAEITDSERELVISRVVDAIKFMDDFDVEVAS